jgi:hypothetical protein
VNNAFFRSNKFNINYGELLRVQCFVDCLILCVLVQTPSTSTLPYTHTHTHTHTQVQNKPDHTSKNTDQNYHPPPENEINNEENTAIRKSVQGLN